LGALAAAAAHELGSPLNTIALASKELLVGRPHADPAFEDIALIAAQSDRCRDILQQLSRDVSTEHQMPFEEQPLSSLIEFAAAPHKRGGITVKVTTEGVNEPRVRLSPELLHGLGNIL